jgi:YQGE family putative transporter
MPKTSFFDRIRRIVGGDSLGTAYYQFLLVHTEFMIFSALPAVFINTFLMKQTGNMDVVLVFNCLNFSGTAIGMFLSSAAVHRFHSGAVSVAGIIGYNLLYLQLILLNARAADFVVLLGITSGLAGAFYWITYSERLTQYTDLTNRDSGMAIISMISSAINMIVPFFAGTVISLVGGDMGYNIVFGIAFIIAIVTAVGALRLPKPKNRTPHIRHTQSFRFTFQHKSLLFSMLSTGFMGIREGAFGFILSILLFRIVHSEVLVGFNTLLSSGAAIASFLIISRKIRGKNRIQYMKIAVYSLLIFSIFTVFKINPIILILFTIVNSFFSGFITNSAFGVFLDIIQTVPGAQEMRPELFAQKELFLATGRCLGILIIMLIDQYNSDFMWQAISLVILTLTQIGTIAASRHAIKLTDQILLQRGEP